MSQEKSTRRSSAPRRATVRMTTVSMTIQPRRIETAETRNGSGTASPESARAEREEPGEDGALRGEPHGDARDADVLGREELAELPLLPLEERLPPDGGEALERLRERGEERVEEGRTRRRGRRRGPCRRRSPSCLVLGDAVGTGSEDLPHEPPLEAEHRSRRRSRGRGRGGGGLRAPGAAAPRDRASARAGGPAARRTARRWRRRRGRPDPPPGRRGRRWGGRSSGTRGSAGASARRRRGGPRPRPGRAGRPRRGPPPSTPPRGARRARPDRGGRPRLEALARGSGRGARGAGRAPLLEARGPRPPHASSEAARTRPWTSGAGRPLSKMS